MSETSEEKEYQSDNIEVLDGIAALRRRPGMGVGSIDAAGLHEMIKIFLGAKNTKFYRQELPASLELALNPDGSFSVKLSWPLIRAEDAKTFKGNSGYRISRLESVMTSLYAPGSGYDVMIPNALSEWAWVMVVDRASKRIYRQDYQRGRAKNQVKEIQDEKTLNEIEPEWVNLFCFKPDWAIFSDYANQYSYTYLFELSRKNALLNPGFKIRLIDQRNPQLLQVNTFHFEKSEAFSYINELAAFDDRESLLEITSKTTRYYPVISARGEAEGVEVNIELGYSRYKQTTPKIAFFINDERSAFQYAGTKGFWKALSYQLTRFGRLEGLLEAADKLTKNETGKGLIAVINIRLVAPKYTGAVKNEGITNPEVDAAIYRVLSKALKEWLKTYPAEAKRLVEGLLEVRKASEKSKKLFQ